MQLHKTLRNLYQQKKQNRLLLNTLAQSFSSRDNNQYRNQDEETLKFDEYDEVQSNNRNQIRYNVYQKRYNQNEQQKNQRSKLQDENDSLKLAEESSYRGEVYNKFFKLARDEKFNTQEFQDLKQDVIKQIQRASSFRVLVKYFSRLSSFNFNDRELLNALAKQADHIKQTFESMDLHAQCQVCASLCMKYEIIDKQYRPSIIYFLETTLRNITKQEVISYKMLDFGINNLSKVFIDDYALYDILMTRFENNVDSFYNYQFVTLIQKVIRLISKLKMNEKYQFTCQVIKLRMRAFMQKPSTVQRMIDIIKIANDPSQREQLGNFPHLQQITITKIAFILSRQTNILVSQNKINLHKNISVSKNNLIDKNNSVNQVDDDEFSDEYQEEYVILYKQAWKQLEQYAKDHYKELENIYFRILLISLVSSKTGDSELYQLMLEEFHHRILTSPYESIENNFYCVCLRSFYTARFTPINIEKYEQTFAEFTRRRFKSLDIPHKMSVFISYSTIGDDKMISFLLEPEQLNQKDIDRLNYKGKIHLFWAFCNVGQFKENLFEHFLINECDPNNSFYGEFPKQLVQITQILYIIKATRKEFWKKHKHILDQKLEDFSELTYFYIKQRFEISKEFQKKTQGSFNLVDILNALGAEFYCDPIIDRIFNVSFLLKGISEAKIQEFKQKNVAAASQFRDLQYQDMQFFPIFDESKHKINKKKDILIEIDDQPHYISNKAKNQSSNCKIDILRKMELQKIAQLQDRKQIIFQFINTLSEQLAQPSSSVSKSSLKKKGSPENEDEQDKSDEQTERH